MRQEIAFALWALLVLAIAGSVWHAARRRRRQRHQDAARRIDLTRRRDS